MPFDPSTTVNTHPDVRVYLEGLLVLCPAQDTVKRCDVYVVSHGSDHLLSVDVSLDHGQPNFPFLRIGGKVLRTGLEIQTDAPKGVTKYAPIAGSSVTDAYPLSEAVDFQVEHDPSVTVETAGCHSGVIKLRDGVLFTAAHRPTAARLERASECKDRAPVGLIIGASVELQGRKLLLKWGPSANEELKLPRDEDDPGSKYIIWINNSRSVPAETNDFKHLYHGLKGVKPGDPFDLIFHTCADLTQTSFRVPCMPGLIGG